MKLTRIPPRAVTIPLTATTLSLGLLLGASSAQSDILTDDLDREQCSKLVVNLGEGRYYTNPVMHFRSAETEYLLQATKTEGGYSYILSGGEDPLQLAGAPGNLQDFTVNKGGVWAVGSAGLHHFSMEGKLLGTYVHQLANGERRRAPRSLWDMGNDQLLVASGQLGLLTFDMTRGVYTSRNPLEEVNRGPNRSAAVSVVGTERGLAYILMTGNSESGFNGILTYNVHRRQVLNTAQYNRRRSGVVDPYAKIYLEGKQVFVNNSGWIHEFSRNDIERSRSINPRWIPITYTQGTYTQYIMLEGDIIFNQDRYLGCATYRVKSSPDDEGREIAGKAFWAQRP